MPDDPIVRFYRHEAPDDRGRMLREIWTWDDDRLERVHDFIQWLFPLREPSMVNDSAPVATDATVAAFAADAALRDALRRSFELMMGFYGLHVEPSEAGRIRIIEGADFARRSRNWITPHNHNHLRLTRILGSVRMLGLPDHGQALFERLRAIYDARRDAISPVTFGYWQRAAR
jgi:opioid growth factor receptor-like protein